MKYKIELKKIYFKLNQIFSAESILIELCKMLCKYVLHIERYSLLSKMIFF